MDFKRLLDFVKIYNYETGYQIEYFEAISAEDKSDYQTLYTKLLQLITGDTDLKKLFLTCPDYKYWQGENAEAVRETYKNIVSEIS